MSEVFITTSAFGPDNVILNGQEYYVTIAAESGASGVEFRRELYTKNHKSIGELGNLIRSKNLIAVYSAPIHLWTVDGELNEKYIRNAVVEAYELDAKIIKFSLGNYEEHSDLNALRNLIAGFYRESKRLTFTVENDQTKDGGGVYNLHRFFEACLEKNIPISMTFDIGNWSFVGEDAFKAAEVLQKYVVYIHAKHVENQQSNLVTLPLPEDLSAEWRKILNILPKHVPRAIEFPVEGGNLIEKTKEYIKLLSER